jgi:hypothetical protein
MAISDKTTQTNVKDEYLAIFGEPINQTLDLATWRQVGRLGDLYGQLQQEVTDAQQLEVVARKAIRDKAFPRISKQLSAPLSAGVYRMTTGDVEAIQRGLLFTGEVEACDGIAASHESLALSVTHIGVCLVSYHADRGSWVHRLYKRDLRESIDDPAKLAEDLINGRFGGDYAIGLDSSRLARRSILAYAERATLVELSTAPWRVGKGNPAPYELLTGSGSRDLILASIDILSRLILEHKKFVFVPMGLDQRGVSTIGDALKPFEYAIVSTSVLPLESIVDAGHYATDVHKRLRAFVKEVGPKMVVGCFRASEIGPARLFYAHVDHAHEAAQIAIADSRLQEHRGYPVLLDLAGEICRTSFGQSDFVATLQDAYAAAGQPYAFHQEFGSGR